MSKIILFCIMMMGGISSQAQSLKTLEWWRNHKLLDSFETDFITLSYLINHLDDSVITPLKDRFDLCREDTSKRTSFFISIDSVFSPGLKKYIESITTYDRRRRKDTSFLHYYTNKELNDYLSTLKAFIVETNALSGDGKRNTGSMSVFKNSNFLNAYFNVCISRSLLLAAMDNLERYFLLGSVADSIVKTSVTTKDGVTKIDNITRAITDTLFKLDSLLAKEFRPAIRLNSKNTKLVKEYPKDKISTAANTILIDNRKNWWWRTLVGGLVGGLVAGLLVLGLK